LVNYWDKYTEMHGQQNVNIKIYVKCSIENFGHAGLLSNFSSVEILDYVSGIRVHSIFIRGVHTTYLI